MECFFSNSVGGDASTTKTVFIRHHNVPVGAYGMLVAQKAPVRTKLRSAPPPDGTRRTSIEPSDSPVDRDLVPRTLAGTSE